MSVKTQKPAPATSAFIRDALEEHPDMLSEENHEATPPTVPTSRDSFSLKNFKATLYGRVGLARSFVTCEEKRETLKLGQINFPMITRARIYQV